MSEINTDGIKQCFVAIGFPGAAADNLVATLNDEELAQLESKMVARYEPNSEFKAAFAAIQEAQKAALPENQESEEPETETTETEPEATETPAETETTETE